MLDQSFSYENFRIILDVENRKGRYLEDEKFFDTDDIFEDSRDITEKIIAINKLIDDEYQKLKKIIVKAPQDFQMYDELLQQKNLLKEEREQKRLEILSCLSERTNSDEYRIKITKGQIKFNSQLYVADDKPEHYFVLKQLQRNIYKTFKVKQADRKSIISQLKILFDDGFPKVIIRTDIKSFYETIPHKHLLSKIEENSLLSYPSKRIIRDILNQYWKILIDDGIKTNSDERVGIPRGIGISAYLAEIYMRDFDRKISSSNSVTYFARYVDDIIIVITPTLRNENISTSKYRNEIKSILFRTSGLDLNLEKTFLIDLRKEKKDRKTSKKYNLTYLGYQFIIGYEKKSDKETYWIEKLPLKILMSENKLERYKKKIISAFENYQLEKIKYAGRENSINRILLLRMKFLTNNFQLFRRKKNVFVGIYFSNEFLNTTDELKVLDKTLKEEILKIENASNIILVSKLNKLSFEKGFKNKLFLNFNFRSFQNSKVLGIWKKL
ncbi:antiviral reverse transcriptase Drt3a [Flavobacterium fluviatile]|uniref:antiviral reverse transcriptase Drt3a n=1 Tax=Flavobacterium fluviatile TaxID=1862387 RepID=UPI0013D0DE54|nr:antiviral reverse transcriptase Drt3a [Flavobacterium fluviatile]